MRRAQVEVIEQQDAGSRPEGDEPNALRAEQDVTREGGREAALKSLAGSLWIEAPDAFEAFAHCFDTKREQLFEVVGKRRSE